MEVAATGKEYWNRGDDDAHKLMRLTHHPTTNRSDRDTLPRIARQAAVPKSNGVVNSERSEGENGWEGFGHVKPADTRSVQKICLTPSRLPHRTERVSAGLTCPKPFPPILPFGALAVHNAV